MWGFTFTLTGIPNSTLRLGRLELGFSDESTVVLSSLAHESRQRGDLVLRLGVTFCGDMTGPYLVGRLLGTGGTAIVHEVRNRAGERFAAKCLSPGRFSLDDLVDRFEREAGHLSEVRHPNIIEYIDKAYAGEDLILVMEMATETLASHLVAGTPALSTAISWLEEALAGVSHLHQLGLVHRDITPRNIMFTQGGRLKLSDFGTAKGHLDPDLTVDRSNVRLGSLIYISNEQRSEPHNAQAADDVFSLGQVGYLLLTGLVPQGNPPPLASYTEIPVEVGAVIERMRSFRRFERFTDAGEALEALQVAATGISTDV